MNAITPLTSNAYVSNAPTKLPGIPRIAELYPLVHTPATLRMKGIGPRRLRNLIAGGTLQRIRRGAYIYNHNADQLNSDDRLRVRCIAADLVGFQGVFSHKSAAVLWGLDLLTVPQMLDAYSRSHCATDRERIHRHKTAISPDEVTRLPGTSIMVTTVARTLQDCARSMPFREAVVLADSIMRRGLLEPCEVTEILLSLTGYGGSAGPLLAQAVDASSESAGESLTRCLLMEHRLPLPVTQYPISCEGRNYRVDFAWPEARVILEFDGEQKYVDHPGRDRQEAARDRALTRTGWTVVHLTWADIFNKELEVVTHLRNLLLK
ncbi:DUF559 domain-containing protein [uncultured Rothia sp.]|uniref:DUF559 domain-containing protein n=1 Tax=uncultured Rothia sp. TaxID=316088 RepID=UPI00288C5508|nr:DUF559 domain-containing protein [uncultured Rothia sp.]